MSWFGNFSLVMRSSITALRERIEDPERMLHQLICDMEEEQESVRHAVAGAIADEIQLGERVARARQEAAQWHERAAAALHRGDEAGATAALDHKVRAEQRADDLDVEYAEQKEQTAGLQRDVSELDDKIRRARQKQTLLLARLARATTAGKVQRALLETNANSAFAQYHRLETRVERVEAMNKAYDRLEGRDPDAEALAREFEQTERKERVRSELEALKAKVQ